jgi:MYXO-CTERM domain-containing protein
MDRGKVLWEEGTAMPAQPTIPDPGSLGSACNAHEDCASKLCVAVDGANVCSQVCSDTKPCPTGFDCTGGYCTKAPDPTADPPVDPPAPDQPAAQPTGQTVQSGGCSMQPRTDNSAAALAMLALVAVVARRRR